jgi:NADH dehydrogenase FAD-containing subunit
MLYILLLTASTFQQAINIVFHFLTGNYFQQIPNPSLTSRTMKNIVILGGSYAGVSTAHRILKQAAKAGPFKITLVSPNTHFYWSIASPRGLVPGQLSDEKLFQHIVAGFNQYPASQFEFILASAESLDVEAKKVGISGCTGNKTLDYDFLVLATGSHTKGDTPFKGLGSTEATKDALHDIQARVKEAKTIVIAGAGVTGVETAGELGFEYGRQKEIILVSLRRLENLST